MCSYRNCNKLQILITRLTGSALWIWCFISRFFRHLSAQDHDCDFDHKAKGKEILAKNNPNISIKGWAEFHRTLFVAELVPNVSGFFFGVEIMADISRDQIWDTLKDGRILQFQGCGHGSNSRPVPWIFWKRPTRGCMSFMWWVHENSDFNILHFEVWKWRWFFMIWDASFHYDIEKVNV